VTDDEPEQQVIKGRRDRLFGADPGLAAVLRITAAAMVATILMWVFT
jgi:hypothetical protein